MACSFVLIKHSDLLYIARKLNFSDLYADSGKGSGPDTSNDNAHAAIISNFFMLIPWRVFKFMRKP